MPTVSLDEDYEVYADIDMADAYLDGAIHADTWRATTDDDTKSRALISATRTLDRQPWVGVRVDPDQPLDWPRTNTGIPGVDGTTPVEIVAACCEIASALLDGSDLQTSSTTATKERSITAGSVSIVNFRGIDDGTRFPQIINELLLPFLGGGHGGAVGVGGRAFGTGGETMFPVETGFNRGL